MNKQIQIKNSFPLFLWLIVLLLWSPNLLVAQQQLLGIYEFEGESGSENQNLSVSSRNPYTFFSKFYRNTPPLNPGTLGKDALFTRSWLNNSTSSPDRYLEFTVSAGGSYQVHISRVAFEASRSDKGPSNARIATNVEGSNYDVKFYNFPVPTNPATISWDGGEVVINNNQSVTFRFYAWNASAGTGNFRLDKVAVYGSIIPNIRINEFHYANTANTGTGFVEVIVPKSFTALNTVTLALYNDEDNNGFGDVYKTETLNNFQFIDTTMYDDYNVFYLNVPEGLADPRGGISLTTQTDLIQFLSYGTVNGLEAVNGPAAGQRSTDIGVTEEANDGPNNAIFLSEGRVKAWTNSEGGVNSKGYRNGENNIILPVELKYFNGITTSKGILLSWATATEEDNDRFVVERSNGTETKFRSVGEVKGKGNSVQEENYQFLDQEALLGTIYYRLKQIDFDGKFTYSKIIACKGRELTGMSIYPNPVSTSMRVIYESTPYTGTVQLRVFNSTGMLVYQKEYSDNNSINTINLSLEGLPAGTYHLVLIKSGEKQNKTFIKL